MGSVDSYIDNVIAKGDEGSELLRAITVHSLTTRPEVDVVDGKAVLRIPQGHKVVVHSTTGEASESGPAMHAYSLVDRLVRDAKRIGATPIGLANVVNTPSSDRETIEVVGRALLRAATDNNVAILNGENAVLGERVLAEANISGTMISIAPERITPRTETRDTTYLSFDPQGKPVFINADGVGTKVEIYERLYSTSFNPKVLARAVRDYAAMNLDDAVKFAAVPRVLSGVVETTDVFPSAAGLLRRAGLDIDGLAASLNTHMLGRVTTGRSKRVRHEARMQGFTPDAYAYNIDGAVVSTIDEERLRNPLRASPGDYVLAIQSDPNPRSNGITARRRVMREVYGENWHNLLEQDPELAQLAAFLATPSTILYSVMSELITHGAASNVFHFSGGAYDSKLAKPLAKQGLSAVINIPEEHIPDIEKRFIDLAGSSLKGAYKVWPMGFDGAITTSNQELATQIIEYHGMRAVPIGHVNEVAKRGGARITTLGKTFEYRYNVGE